MDGCDINILKKNDVFVVFTQSNIYFLTPSVAVKLSVESCLSTVVGAEEIDWLSLVEFEG